ncbi:MAG: sheath polysaccharide-degrading enzyme, partial [Flavobacteriales bacterium]|nr:sheath polysaccharide-degrading enzyme [Flavobacteriales bacterium]
MNFKSALAVLVCGLGVASMSAQSQEQLQHATFISNGTFLGTVPSIADQLANGTFIPAENIQGEVNPKRADTPKGVPGKGALGGPDPLMERQVAHAGSRMATDPLITWECATSGATPSDPTGAVGPDHFVNSWNSAFRIWDKDGNSMTPAASLATIWSGESSGDPIVMYDSYADRFFISQFAFPASFLVAVSTGPDPVNDDWYTYEFSVDQFPDYPKWSLWSDGYYVTANKNSGNAGNTEVIYAIERDLILAGEASPQMVGFPLPDIVTAGFYSPLAFNGNGSVPPPAGNVPVTYVQDNTWAGVSSDHLKVWTVNVDWSSPASSTISDPEIIETEPFDGWFDGGSFSNLPQPSGPDIDCLQAT